MSDQWLACNNIDLTLGASAPTQVLGNVTVNIERGEWVAVVGPSGSGKTSLLHLLGCLRRPTGGTLAVCGQSDPTGRAAIRLRRRHIGFVFQEFNLFAHLSAEENVIEGLAYQDVAHSEKRRRARSLLTEMGLADRLHHPPRKMSGGEQQRVAIARALVKNPDLILADEPTGNLDSGSSSDVMQTIGQAHIRGATVIVVTHNAEVAAKADREIVIQDGTIVTAVTR
ncbi:ABC transporter, ATP-binding protein [hydrothermal vent metagenome]|uniref:ABC transporter, ATP-binding protein n=1 Tax=hydrothermal vent metagenome TaxID=652676 RepID=A0A3B0SY69_9ZZZZ